MSFMSAISPTVTTGELNMVEVTAPQAAEILGKEPRTAQRWVEDGLLPARREGPRLISYIDLEDLRAFAAKYNYRFNEAIAQQYTK
jgi:hypothetical protein